MKIKNVAELQNEILNSGCLGCYLLFSSEFFSVNGLVNEMVKSLVNREFLAFNFHEFDGTDLQFDELQNFLNTVPLMSKFRVALVKNLCYLESGNSFLKQFESVVVKLPETSILIVTVSTEGFDFSKSKKFKLSLETFSKFAKIFDCSFSSKNDIFKYFSSWVSKNGSKINKINFDFLLNRVSRSWPLVFSELEKLCSYAHGREISKYDILKLTRINLSSTAFELANSILNFEVEKALTIFRNLVDVDFNMFLILGAINSCFIDLFRVFVCSRRGLTDAQISKIFNYRGLEFKIRKARNMVQKFDLAKLKSCIDILSKLDLKLKTSTISWIVLVERAIVKMASRS